MHENREISCTPWSSEQDRSAKAINRTADVNVPEKSDCAVVPVNQPNKEGQPSAEAGEGRAQTEGEHRSVAHAPDTERETHVPGIGRCAESSKEKGSRNGSPLCSTISTVGSSSRQLLRPAASSFAGSRWRDVAGV